MVMVPGAAGEIGVLARHAPLVAMLKAGPDSVSTSRKGQVLEFATGPGFFKVEQDRALALVDHAVDARPTSTSTPATTPSSRRRPAGARAASRRGESEADRWQLEQRIKHAENQLTVSGRARLAEPASTVAGDGENGFSATLTRLPGEL